VILHIAHTFMVGCALACIVLVIATVVGRVYFAWLRHDERRRVREIERSCELSRIQVRQNERHRLELRSYSARETAGERYGRVGLR
jgi:hypothetical protein